jgi:DNA primase
VAPCGTSLTEDHIRVLQRFAKTIVLAFDPDAAGQAAAERVYEWEQKLEIDVAVADLPKGQDPGDLARSDPERLRAAVSGRMPFLGFRVGRVLSAGRLDTPEARARTAEAALVVVAEHPDELVRDQYVMEISDRCRLDVERLRAVLRAGPRAPAETAAAPRRSGSQTGHGESNADRMLRLAVDPTSGAEARDLLGDVLFTEDHHIRAWHTLRDADGDLHAALAAADPDVADLLGRLAVEDTVDTPRDIRRALLRDAIERTLADLRREATEVGDYAPYSEAVAWLQLQREAMKDENRPGRDVEDQLLAWLSERSMETA